MAYKKSVRPYRTPPSSGFRVSPAQIKLMVDLAAKGATGAAKAIYYAAEKRGRNTTPTPSRNPKQKTYQTKATQTSRRSVKWSGVSTGRYSGKFKKPTRPKKTIKTVALQKGYAQTLEQYGRCGDPNVVYMGHSTKNIAMYARTITGALLREIFIKAGIPVAAKDTVMDLAAYNNSSGFRFIFQTQLLNGQVNNATVMNLTSTTRTFDQVIDDCNWMTEWFVHFLNSVTGEHESVPFMLSLYALDQHGGDDSWTLSAQLNLLSHKITFVAKSTMVIQNRTAGASAVTGNLDSDRVDNQPLYGKIYEFSQATPRLRHPEFANGELQRFPSNGLNLQRGALLDVAFNNCPDNKVWSNCGKTSKIVLQPGDMKQHSISHSYSGKLITVLNRMKNAQNLSTEDFFLGGSGSSAFIVLEEKIRTTSLNIITCQYERRIDTMAFCSPTKTPPLVARFESAEVDEFP